MTIDLTGVAAAVIAGVFTVATPVAMLWIQNHLKDQQAALVIGNAVKNSLGAIQQAAQEAVTQGRTVRDPLAPGIRYVQEQAGPELERFPEITTASLAAKIQAQAGLAVIAQNIQTAASPSPTVPPLAPVPPTPKGPTL
jgi:hypothetical protein